MMSILFGVQSFECSAQRVSVATQQQRGRQRSYNSIEKQSYKRYQALLDRTEQVLSELQQNQRLQGAGKVSYSKRVLRLLAIKFIKIVEWACGEIWGGSKFLAKQTIKLIFSNTYIAVPFSLYIISKLGLAEKAGAMSVDVAKDLFSGAWNGLCNMLSGIGKKFGRC